MPQTIALQVKNPEFDYPGLAHAAQAYRRGEMSNELAGIKLNEARDESTALGNYRKSLQADDPNALDQLKTYPEIQQKIFDAFDGMTPKDYQAARKRASRFGEAARNITMFAPGSPEREAAWRDEIDKLEKEGDIDSATAERMRTSGSDDLIIHQALMVDEYVKQYAGKNAKGELDAAKLEQTKARTEQIRQQMADDSADADTPDELTKARIAEIRARTLRGEGKAYLEIQKAVTERRKSLGLNDPFNFTDDDARQKAEAELKQFEDDLKTAIYKGEQAGTVEGGPDEIARPASQAEFDALPVGAVFINPKDGKRYRKK